MKHKILIADDDANVVELLSSILKKEGYSILKAENGKKAVEIAREKLPSLIMLDIHMPEKNGIEALKEIKSHTLLKNIPVVILTVEGSPGEIQQCMNYGANTYITKPASKENILKVVKNLLL